ncbi:MAG: hypothetical protein KJO04_02400 [Bacteroidia bacterium]|nr:hypothetical protein [Bacteroidia bacterium]
MSKAQHTLQSNEFIIYDKEDYIQVHANGAKTFEFAASMWQEVVKRCNTEKKFKILGIALTSDPLKKEEADNLLPFFKELGLDQNYKIAWVELNPEYYDIILYSESLMSSNGIDAKFFYEVGHAKAWLNRDQ